MSHSKKINLRRLPIEDKPAKILVIVGPTASGKSDLAVKLAKKFNGEVISADSRQVYKGLNIGTGKITKKEMSGIKHHLLDVVDPKKQFTVIEFKKLADKVIADIIGRDKLPIICGGTGLYIDAVVNGREFPTAGPNKSLRAKLAEKSAAQLLQMLEKLDPARASRIASNNSEKSNCRRLIRAIEIATEENQARKMEGGINMVSNTQADESAYEVMLKPALHNKYDAFWIGIKVPREELRERIHSRLLKRLKLGMLNEAKRLHARGLSWKRMNELGLEYRYEAELLQGHLERNQFIEILTAKIWQYARRQMTWFKRNSNIKWFARNDSSKVAKKLAAFLAE